MTGTELIKFIKENNLENENISIEYFSWQKNVKYCGKCETLVNLEDFHKGTTGAEPEMSSHYRYICKACLNKAAFHKKYKKREEMGI